MTTWNAYTFEGDYEFQLRHVTLRGQTLTAEDWDSGELIDGTDWLRVELSEPDDRWKPETAGPDHNYTVPWVNLFVLCEQPAPLETRLTPDNDDRVSVWLIERGYVYDLSAPDELRSRLNSYGARMLGEIEVKIGNGDRLYLDLDLASSRQQNILTATLRGELVTHRHYGKVTWRTNSKGIKSRFNESHSVSTWP